MRNIVFIILTFFAITALAFPFNEILPRQKGGETESAAPATTKGQSTADSSTQSADSASITDRPESTGTDESDSKQSKTSKSSKSKTKGMLVDPMSPVGTISMITPGPLDGPQYYKFGDNVTFAWNYTNVIVSPTAVNIIAVCSNAAQEQTWTISRNVSMKTTSIIWDTKPDSTDKQTPLVMGTYTLIIYDDSTSPTAVAQAGYLQGGGTQFGMYSPRDPTPLSSYECAVCENSGATNIDPNLMRMAAGTGALFLGSFLWFVRISL